MRPLHAGVAAGFPAVEGLLYELEECAEDLRSYADQLDFDAEDLERTESRLEIIRRLTTKYGGSEEAALEFLEQARQELETIEMSDELAARLRAELETAREDLIAAAEKLTTARRDAAALFTRRVGEELAFLDMPGVTLEVSMESAPLTGRRRGSGGIPHRGQSRGAGQAHFPHCLRRRAVPDYAGYEIGAGRGGRYRYAGF